METFLLCGHLGTLVPVEVAPEAFSKSGYGLVYGQPFWGDAVRPGHLSL